MKTCLPTLLLTLSPGVALAAVPLSAFGPDGLRVSGAVTEVEEGQAMISDGTGVLVIRLQRLVDIEPALVPGERVTVTGDYRRGRFEAVQLERDDGQIYQRAARERKKKERGKDASSAFGGPRGGRPVLPGEQAADIPPSLRPDELAELLVAAGYRAPGAIALHPRHYAVEALNPWNERVEVHMDFSRRIYKERRLPE